MIEVALNTSRQWVRLIAGLAVLLVIVGGFCYAAAVTDSTAKRVLAIAVAFAVLVFTVAVGIGGWLATRPHRLAFAPDGFGLIGRRGLVWRVLWPEVETVTVLERTSRMRRRARIHTITSTDVTLVIRPAGDGFGPQHPELKRYYQGFGAGPGEYGVHLGPSPELIEPIRHALAATAGSANGGGFGGSQDDR